MIKIDKRCRVCQLIEAGDTKLLKRLYNSSHYKGKAGEPMTAILAAYEGKFNRNGLWRHLTKHQALNEADLTQATLNEIAKSKTNSLVKQAISHGSVRELVLEKGYKGIASGKIKLKASDVIKAAKDQADIEEKQKDRSALVMLEVYKIASGERNVIPGANNPAGDTSVIDVT